MPAIYATLLILWVVLQSLFSFTSSPVAPQRQQEAIFTSPLAKAIAPQQRGITQFPQVVQQPSAISVTAKTDTYCRGSSELSLQAIEIEEEGNGDFSGGPINVTLELRGGLNPENYDFVAGQGRVEARGGSTDITITNTSITAEAVSFTITVSGTATLDAIVISGLQVSVAEANREAPGSARIRQRAGTNPLGIGANTDLALIDPSPDLAPTIDGITNGPLCGSSAVDFEVSLDNGDFSNVTSARAIRNRGNVILATYGAASLPNSGTTATLTAAASGDWQTGDQLIFEVTSDGCPSTSAGFDIPLANNGDLRIGFDYSDVPEQVANVATGSTFFIGETAGRGTFRVFDATTNRQLIPRDEYTITGSNFAYLYNNDLDQYQFRVGGSNTPFSSFTLEIGGTGADACISTTFSMIIIDNNPQQLVGIEDGTVCENASGSYEVGWVGQGIFGKLISIESFDNCSSTSPNNVISGSVDSSRYQGGTNSSVFINPSGYNSLTGNCFAVKIRYEVRDDTGVLTGRVRTVCEVVNIEAPTDITVTLTDGSRPEEAYCATSDPIELFGEVDNQSLIGAKTFSVTDLSTNTEFNFQSGSRRLRFADPPASFESTAQGITLVPNGGSGYRINYTFTSLAGCVNEGSEVIYVNPSPSKIPDLPSFNYCVSEPLTPIDLGLPDLMGALDPAQQIEWLTSTGLPLDTIPFNGRYLPEDITNLRIGTYDYLVRLISPEGCPGPTTPIQAIVGEVPQADFTFREACDDQEVQVWDASIVINNSDPNSVITRWRWDFGDGTIVDAPTGETQTHVYTDEPNVYTVTLITETAIGCSDTVAKQVVVYESPTLNNETAYVATFEEGQDGWVASRETENGNGIGREANWERTMIPDTTVATGMIGVWRNDYNNDENSWIESPCIDLTNVDNPFVNMRIRYDLEPGADGVVMQVGYDRDSTIEDETRRITVWERLGEQGAGLNWYNTLGVTGFPVTDDFPGYDEPRIGWSDSTGWVEASLDLASVKAAANGDPVRFRLFLGSNNDNVGGEKGTGFILDQFEVLNRERVVLIEHFSNLNEDNQQDFPLEEFLDSTRAEVNIVDLRYHTILPFQDEVTLVGVSQAPNSGRSLHYKVASPPQVVIDGARVNLAGEDFRIWSDTTATYYGQRILTKSLFDIVITPPTGATAGNPATLEATVTRNSVGDSTLTPNAILVHMAIVEKEAEHGGRTLYNLVRNMLPTAAGTRFDQTWNAGEQVVVQNAFQPYRDITEGEFMLVVFVADEETKDIYQAAFVDLPASVGSSSREGLAERFEQVMLYPNPTSGLTNGRFTVAIPAALTQEQQWTVYDMLGKPHLRGTWPLNTWEVEIDASRLAEGTYIFQMEGIKQFFVVMRD